MVEQLESVQAEDEAKNALVQEVFALPYKVRGDYLPSHHLLTFD